MRLKHMTIQVFSDEGMFSLSGLVQKMNTFMQNTEGDYVGHTLSKDGNGYVGSIAYSPGDSLSESASSKRSKV